MGAIHRLSYETTCDTLLSFSMSAGGSGKCFWKKKFFLMNHCNSLISTVGFYRVLNV